MRARGLRLLLAAAYLLSVPGPAFHHALAQTVTGAAAAGASSGSGVAGAGATTGVAPGQAPVSIAPVAVPVASPAGGLPVLDALPAAAAAAPASPALAPAAFERSIALPTPAAAASPASATRALAAARPASKSFAARAAAWAARTARSIAGRPAETGETLRASSHRVSALLADPFRASDPAAEDDDEKTPIESPAGAPTTLAEATLEPAPGRTYMPSREDWADASIYSLVIDRFQRTKESITRGDPKDPHSVHGGNLKGVIEKLDYIRGMGFTELMVSPVAMNPPDPNIGYYAYHKYWPVHFMAVDPDLGTMEDFKLLVDEAHKRGMRVILDMVFNHAGPVFKYEGSPKWDGKDPKKIKKWQYPVWPKEIQTDRAFVRRGPIDDWEDEDQRKNGDFPPDLRKFDLANPPAQDVMIHVAKWWIKETDIDGIRLDTYDHIHKSFWDRFSGEVQAYAAGLGKANFLVLAELFHGDAARLAPEIKSGRVNSMYNYPAYFWEVKDVPVLHGQAKTLELEWGLGRMKHLFGEAAKRMVHFLDNQDKPRFLREKDPVGILKSALSYVLLSVGIPLVYYGTEQALRHYGSEDLGFGTIREDLWETGFDTEAEVYKHLAALNAARERHPALRRGEMYSRWADPNGAGLFVFSRILDGEEVVVAVNTSAEPRAATFFVDSGITPPGTELVDELDPSYAVTAAAMRGGSMAGAGVPGHGVRVLVRKGPPRTGPAPPAK